MRDPPAAFPTLTCDGRLSPPQPRRLWRLSSEQYRTTIGVFFAGRGFVRNTGVVPKWLVAPFEDATPSDRFSNQAASYGMGEFELRRVVSTAHEIATRFVIAQQANIRNCLVSGSTMPFLPCLRSLIAERGSILFRRPLRPEEMDRYTAIAERALPTLAPSEAAALALQAMLVSPQFIYLGELAETDRPGATLAPVMPLGPYEVASALAYTLTDWPPDNMLWEAARTNQLATVAQISPHVTRLLGRLDAPPLERFVREYFRYTKVLDVFKDVPGHDPAYLLKEADAFVRENLRTQGRAKFLESLLTADWGYASRFSAVNWGMVVSSYVPVRVAPPAGQRAGLMTQPSFLAAFSEMSHNQPVQRGRFISETLLCQAIPDLPIDQVPELPDLGATATLRDRLAVHTKTPGCAVCHRLMDPLGLPFEHYDDIGRVRDKDQGNQVNATGAVIGAGSVDGPVIGPTELAAKLAKSSVVEDCFIRHSFRYWLGRRETSEDACVIQQMVNSYRSGSGDYGAALQSLFTSPSFLARSTK